jgi:hypothetical protein
MDKRCEVIQSFNSTVSKIIAISLQSFFNEETKSSIEVKNTSVDTECPIVRQDPWVKYCLTVAKKLKMVTLGGDIVLDSQEAYRLKIYAAGFI